MRHLSYVSVGLLLLVQSVLAGPPVLDGSAAETLYGTALVVQDTQTGFGDALLGRPDVCNGSELDAAYAVIYQNTLYLVFAGNLQSNGNKLEIFFDTRAGGQNRLLATNPGTANEGLLRMSDDGSGNGLIFQAGFNADFWVSVNCYGDPTSVYVDYAELYVGPSNPGALYYCGAGSAKCTTVGGALTGGDPGAPAILCTVDNSNVLGVTGGFGASDGSGVLTGVELAIPLSAIGNPAGAFTITAFINGTQHHYVSNQVLGGLAGLTYDNLGDPRYVDFTTVAFGIQTPFTVLAVATPTGACCVGTTCSIKTQAQCTGASGTYRGDNTNCDGNPCNSTPQGRCCIDDGYSGQCLIREQAQCNSLGGTWSGASTTCDGCPCLIPPKGACCIVDYCEQQREADCTAIGGAYAGDFSDCGFPGNSPCDQSACCTETVCTDGPRFQCTALGGRFVGVGSTCTPGLCDFTITTPYVAGDMQSPPWLPDTNPMTETTPGSHIWTITFTGLAADGRYEWKVTDGTWNNTIPPGPNSWLYADAGGRITITYDANYYADGWSPNRDRLGLSVDPLTWTATGDFLAALGGSDWDNAAPAGAMAAQGDGIYQLEFTGIPPATYHWKAVKTGTWDSISWDGRSVYTANMEFTTATATDTVKLWVNALAGDVKVDILPGVTVCIGDLNCDGMIDFGDINPFVLYLSSLANWQNAFPGCNPENGDINCDGIFGEGSFGDINPFVALMTQCGSGCTCPGPVSCP